MFLITLLTSETQPNCCLRTTFYLLTRISLARSPAYVITAKVTGSSLPHRPAHPSHQREGPVYSVSPAS